MRILLAGATGFIGSELTNQLLNDNHELHILSRSKKNNSNHVSYFTWEPHNNKIDLACLQDVDAVINLAGANVGAKRWTKKFKQEIRESRILSTRLIIESLNKTQNKVKVFINTSAIGIYGNKNGQVLLNEDSPKGKDFLAEVVEEWEKELLEPTTTARKVILRLGIVFSINDGALPKLMRPVKYGIGAPLASGEQYLSWVDLQDVIDAFKFSLKNEQMEGIFNVVAPGAVSNRILTQTIAKMLHRPLFLPNIPAFTLKIILGEFAESIIGGSNVSPNKLIGQGFKFSFPALESSLKQHI